MPTVNKIPWETYYQTLCQIYEEEGTVNIPYNASYKKNGLAIGRWVRTQRRRYAIGKMSQDRINKLERLGFVWNGNEIVKQRLKEQWDNIFALAEAYYKEKGNLRIPRHYVIDDFDVGNWLTNLKGSYRGNNRRHLTEYQISKLESIGIEWDFDFFDDLWNQMYNCAECYFANYGDIFIPQGFYYEGNPLGNWIHDQTQLYKKGKLSQDRIDKLNKLGIRWYPQQDKWTTYYKYAKKYYKEIGNLDVPNNFEIDGISLGRWISVQRQAYNGRQDTILTDKQIKKLEAIGMVWKGDANTQTSFWEQIIYYYLAKAFPSTISRYNEIGFELDIYIPELKVAIEYDGYYWHKDKQEKDNCKDVQCKKKGVTLIRIRESLLPSTQYAKCYILPDNSIDSFQKTIVQVLDENFHIHPSINIKRDSFEVVKNYKLQVTSPWYKAFLEAKRYYEDNGNLIVHKGFVTSSGLSLDSWIKNQRQRKKGNHKPLSLEQITLLESIGMVWDPYALSWEIGYSYARMYYEEFNNLLVPQEFVYKEFALGKWINGQRIHRKEYLINKPERIIKLEGIGMVWNAKETLWEEGFMFAKEYYENNGNLLVPSDYRTSDGFCLGIWIQCQRKMGKEERLYDKDSRIERLNTIGMIWDVDDYYWNRNLNAARQYFQDNGNLLIPSNYIVDGILLGQWISNLRNIIKKKNSRLTKERIQQLEEIKMVWNVLDYSWDTHYSLVCEYYEEYGTVDMPRNTFYKNVDLGTWLRNLRIAKKKGRKTYLTDERILLMEKLGMKW